ncbi:serine hydrolase [Synechococcus sp. Nb3U1]|uniref:serine hydrolase n=1 Tax=Synechococcus sp. Nb3U1 TaxID=1914529 RepID=UPI001F35866C|nr:serine hydrolase [Synechococcus sp. Nb3U1]MCF2970851.1 serine hydrolase [Synechococcus sp. Nb3U1]
MNSRAHLQADLAQVFESFQLPGLAVAVLANGEISPFEFGYRDLATREPFTCTTLCLVASVSKSFTATLAGILVDQGQVAWQEPVRHYWPELHLVDEEATQFMTLTDMLCHRTGLPYHENLLAEGVGRDLPGSGRDYRQKLLKRLAYFDPSQPFRTEFQYQDIVFTCAGALLESITGRNYEDLIQEHWLDPLGMTDSTFSRQAALATGRLAQGYGWVEGQIQPIPHCDTRYIAPSAGLYSTASDLMRWLQLQLEGGVWEGKPLISPASLRWIHRPHMAIGAQVSLVGGGLATYGLGWIQSSIGSELMLSHGGSFNGYRTTVAFIPARGFGVAVLTNLNVSNANTIGALVVMDRLLGQAQVEARVAYGKRIADRFAQQAAAAEQAFWAGRDPSAMPQHPLDNYVGQFQHPGYGTFTITQIDGCLWQTYDERTYPLDPYQGETFSTRFQSTENRLLHLSFTFETDAEGLVVAVRIPIVEDIPPPRFVRVV